MATPANDNDLFSPLSLSIVCNLCTAKMQTVADLLLLTSDTRPVNTDNVTGAVGESFSKCRDTLIAKTKGVGILSREIRLQFLSGKLQETAEMLNELTDLVVNIIECSSHAAYLAAISESGSKQAVPGIIDRYKISRARFDIEHCCMRLQYTPLMELSPQVVVDISTEIAKNLTILTNASKLASDASDDPFHKEQFKLAIKSVTSCTSTLLLSIRRYKVTLDEANRGRCITFAKPLVQSCQALVEYATEREHIGTPAQLSESGRKIQTAILGGCMSIASSCIQLASCLRAASQDLHNQELVQRLGLCCNAVADGGKLLSQALRDKSSPRTLPSTSTNSLSSNGSTNSFPNEGDNQSS
ncbi:mesoderm development candidate 1-like [Acanthaster planci]|uniref:Mesoderm development candidate 1-like n=1 Tax=Acanthaster planci TaxID=133434 RepID=A0A8B7ZM56_ACAPL|nr:mesoderm development candidate 1-like [Acanthaster planci]XP_022106523.1 mesoderm development candidate 1-like [Acanthaster planci]XP_022106524.1 mesoderm development candidate 1-like [Acanthaster planci]XP_022106525.1 mesoderm development candidate 1-like [Acanthaster planci]